MLQPIAVSSASCSAHWELVLRLAALLCIWSTEGSSSQQPILFLKSYPSPNGWICWWTCCPSRFSLSFFLLFSVAKKMSVSQWRRYPRSQQCYKEWVYDEWSGHGCCVDKRSDSCCNRSIALFLSAAPWPPHDTVFSSCLLFISLCSLVLYCFPNLLAIRLAYRPQFDFYRTMPLLFTPLCPSSRHYRVPICIFSPSGVTFVPLQSHHNCISRHCAYYTSNLTPPFNRDHDI